MKTPSAHKASSPRHSQIVERLIRRRSEQSRGDLVYFPQSEDRPTTHAIDVLHNETNAEAQGRAASSRVPWSALFGGVTPIPLPTVAGLPLMTALGVNAAESDALRKNIVQRLPWSQPAMSRAWTGSR